MPAVTHAPIWYPPQFPERGRLPNRPEQLQLNISRQNQLEREYHGALSVAAGRLVSPPCCKTLHVSLFFDGTGNNLFDDLYRSPVPHPTNIARLFRATIGAGYAGGAASVKGLTDPPGTGQGKYFKYYMPGVGTPFPEVGDLDYSTTGLAFGSYGEERINWALLMLIDALRQYLELPRLGDRTLYASVKAMGEVMNAGGRGRRKRELSKQLLALGTPLRIALQQPSQGRPKLVGLKLYVYGFSRGAAAARAFVNWLDQLLTHEDPAQPALLFEGLRLPVEVRYLGLLDTVASVGVAAIAPGARGQMGWADETQQLPSGNGLVKRCLHLVAAHEQRLCFPLESIRRETGGYPINSQEVLYPGVHSDLGGGYPRGDQGKAVGNGDGQLLSQLALHDLFADAFSQGAPLKVPQTALPEELRHERWRVQEDEGAYEFELSPTLVDRFNAWRNATLGLALRAHESEKDVGRYLPTLSTEVLEQAFRTQLGWLTAWRIDRYAFASLKDTPFYRQATDTHSDPALLTKDKAERDKAQAKLVKERTTYQRLFKAQMPLEPGLKDIDPDLAQTQLREAATEFAKAFRDPSHLRFFVDRMLPARMPSPVYEVIHVDAGAECLQMKAAGRARVSQLFPPPPYFRNHVTDDHRGQVDETLNATEPGGLLRALFDDHVHDSRAWFLFSLGREPMGSYFRERMVFFGEASRRELALNDQQDLTLLAAHLVPPPLPVMDAQQFANAQRELAERFELYRASLVERTNEAV